jgi:hypothetical protein
MLFKNFLGSSISAGLMLLLLVSSAAQAESACKGLASSQCSAKSDCVWVGGYTRKDNRKVSGYCRAKGGKGATSSTKKTRNASASKDSSSKSGQTSTKAKKKSSSKNKNVTEKESTKQSSGKKSKKGKSSTKKKSAEKSKSGSSKAKTKEKKKTKKTKTAE